MSARGESVDWKEFFKICGRETVSNSPFTRINIEDLYENFKARMDAENAKPREER